MFNFVVESVNSSHKFALQWSSVLLFFCSSRYSCFGSVYVKVVTDVMFIVENHCMCFEGYKF